MTIPNWKSIAELIGAAAIVASLVFVGLQLRLEQAVSTAQLQQDMIAARIELSGLLSQHADVLSKANSGESLTDSEELVLDNIISSIWGWGFFGHRRWEAVNHPAVNAPMRGLAIFLHKNPGAKRAYARFVENQSQSIEKLGGSNSIQSGFNEQVSAYLALLEDNSE